MPHRLPAATQRPSRCPADALACCCMCIVKFINSCPAPCLGWCQQAAGWHLAEAGPPRLLVMNRRSPQGLYSGSFGSEHTMSAACWQRTQPPGSLCSSSSANSASPVQCTMHVSDGVVKARLLHSAWPCRIGQWAAMTPGAAAAPGRAEPKTATAWRCFATELCLHTTIHCQRVKHAADDMLGCCHRCASGMARLVLRPLSAGLCTSMVGCQTLQILTNSSTPGK